MKSRLLLGSPNITEQLKILTRKKRTKHFQDKRQCQTSNLGFFKEWIHLSFDTPLKFNSSPRKNWWLEDDPFLLGFGKFSGSRVTQSSLSRHSLPPPNFPHPSPSSSTQRSVRWQNLWVSMARHPEGTWPPVHQSLDLLEIFRWKGGRGSGGWLCVPLVGCLKLWSIMSNFFKRVTGSFGFYLNLSLYGVPKDRGQTCCKKRRFNKKVL